MRDMTSESYHFADPQEARIYIAEWAPRLLGKKATFVETNKRRINFASMSDADACFVAAGLWAMERKALPRGH